MPALAAGAILAFLLISWKLLSIKRQVRKRTSTPKGEFDFIVELTNKYYALGQHPSEKMLWYWIQPVTLEWAEQVLLSEVGMERVSANARLIEFYPNLTPLMRLQVSFPEDSPIPAYLANS